MFEFVCACAKKEQIYIVTGKGLLTLNSLGLHVITNNQLSLCVWLNMAVDQRCESVSDHKPNLEHV